MNRTGALQLHPAILGLVQRRERWTLSLRGWLAVLVVMAATVVVVLWRIHSFLAVTDRVDAKFLVVEGWIPKYALQKSANEFRAHPYQRLITAGGPLRYSSRLDEDDTYAHRASSDLRHLGVSPAQLATVPFWGKARDEEYGSALAVKQWLTNHATSVKAINVVTLGTHARRTRLVYQKAMGDAVSVGVIAISDRDYDPCTWWRYSEGVKETISEACAYLFVRILGCGD